MFRRLPKVASVCRPMFINLRCSYSNHIYYLCRSPDFFILYRIFTEYRDPAHNNEWMCICPKNSGFQRHWYHDWGPSNTRRVSHWTAAQTSWWEYADCGPFVRWFHCKRIYCIHGNVASSDEVALIHKGTNLNSVMQTLICVISGCCSRTPESGHSQQNWTYRAINNTKPWYADGCTNRYRIPSSNIAKQYLTVEHVLKLCSSARSAPNFAASLARAGASLSILCAPLLCHLILGRCDSHSDQANYF